MNNSERGTLVVIEGLDGSGKSTTAQDSAISLSELYPDASIGVADSTGLYSYQNGELQDHRYSRLIELEPKAGAGKLHTVGALGAFTLARKFVDYQGLKRSDVLVSVRDPQRVDPAAYSAVYNPGVLGRMSADARLRVFDKVARTGYPDAIIQLTTNPELAQANATNLAERDFTCPHEDLEKMAILAEELPLVLRAFSRMFDRPVHEVGGLLPSTVEMTVGKIEPLVARAAA